MGTPAISGIQRVTKINNILESNQHYVQNNDLPDNTVSGSSSSNKTLWASFHCSAPTKYCTSNEGLC